MASGKKLDKPFGHITQREWDGLIARGADLAHIAMYGLIRVRADRDGVTRDSVPALMKRTNRSEDTAERLLKWLRDHGVMAQQRVSSRKGPEHLTWLYERRALPIEEWTESASMPPPPLSGVRIHAPSVRKVESANTSPGVRKSTPRSPQRLGDNPDVPQRKPQTAREVGQGSPSEDVREGTGRLEEAEALGLADVSQILAKSHHAAAFEGKLNDLADLVLRYPDRDVEQACADLIEKVPVIRFDSKAITVLESFIEKAPRVAPRDWREDLSPDEIRERIRVVRVPSVDEQVAEMKRRDRAALKAVGIE